MVTEVVFAKPKQIDVASRQLPEPESDQVFVSTRLSAISAGTELMIYRGEAPQGQELDATLPALSGTFGFPLRYGYSAVGEVMSAGSEVDPSLIGRRVFGFQPHASHFVAKPEDLILLPDQIPDERALFIPNLESALNFAHDGAPLVGEEVLIVGQGVVGLLTTALLSEMRLGDLRTVDPIESRRKASIDAGANRSFSPSEFETSVDSADLSIELSGTASGLALAISGTGFSGRVVLGSWYRDKPLELQLGEAFHRSRIELISSQVSTINPQLSGRWDKPRRMSAALHLLEAIEPEQWITHQFEVSAAAEAYRLLDERHEEALQVVLTYGDADPHPHRLRERLDADRAQSGLPVGRVQVRARDRTDSRDG